MREFNTTGLCVPRKHYMVDISGRVAQMRAMVERGDYFCVNRARQYGKTTTLAALEDALADYLGERFVVELKVWRGPRYNEDGERQVAGYLDHFGLDVGYMLSFNFNMSEEPGMRRVAVGDKVVWEETV